jgi:hypothetical protein
LASFGGVMLPCFCFLVPCGLALISVHLWSTYSANLCRLVLLGKDLPVGG